MDDSNELSSLDNDDRRGRREDSEMEEEEKYYRTDENLEKIDPQTSLSMSSHYFYAGITGHIESGEFRDLDGLSLKFDFIAGDSWEIQNGKESGISQHSFKSQGMNKRIVWNFPFELTYRSLNVQGWP